MSVASKSYEYNAICDICGFKKKSYELQKRWDGYWVCKEDWEPRHILDFYRTKNDTHQLPFTRPDSQVELTWTPVFTGFTQTPGTGTITITGTYTKDTLNNKINFLVEIAITGNATTTSSPATISLPVLCTVAGTVRTSDSQSVQLGNTSITVLGNVIQCPAWTNVNRTINISGSYGY
jgi:hypothetical protein